MSDKNVRLTFCGRGNVVYPLRYESNSKPTVLNPVRLHRPNLWRSSAFFSPFSFTKTFPFFFLLLPLFHRLKSQSSSSCSTHFYPTMAETLTLFTSPSTCIPLSREQSASFQYRRFPRPKSRSFRFAVKSSTDDGFGLFPWENPHLSESCMYFCLILYFSHSTTVLCLTFDRLDWCCSFCVAAIQWVSEDKVTLFTSDGMVQIGGNLVPRRVSSNDVYSSFLC